MTGDIKMNRYCVVLYDQRLDIEQSMIVAASTPHDAITIAEQAGAVYTDAEVREGNYEGDTLASYGEDGFV